MGDKPSKPENDENIVYVEKPKSACEKELETYKKWYGNNVEFIEKQLCNNSNCKNDPNFIKDYGKTHCNFEGFTSIIEPYNPMIEASAMQELRRVKDLAQDTYIYSEDSRKGAEYSNYQAGDARAANKRAQSAGQQAILNSGKAKNAFEISQQHSENAEQQYKNAQQYSEGAQKQSQGAEKSAKGAKKSAIDAENSANKTQQSQQDVEVMQQNAESDVKAFQDSQGLAGYNGTAGDISRRMRELEEKQEQFKKIATNMPLSKDVVEGHLFAFQKDGYSYLESLDENEKINILTHMVAYYQDFADNYRESFTKILNLQRKFDPNMSDEDKKKNKEEINVLENKVREIIPEWIKKNENSWYFDTFLPIFMYYYIKYNYENSGSETLGYQVFLNIKNVLSTLFESDTQKMPPGYLFQVLNSNESEVRELKYTYYLENKSKQPFTNIKEYFTNLIEGNTGMSSTTTDPLVQNNDNFIDIIRNYLNTTEESLVLDRTNLLNSINNIKRYQDGEYLAQRDTIMNNVLMDYMINNEEGSNVERVYEKLNQEKNDKLRKTKIAAYYTKSFKEYIYLLKIVIFLIVLMIPILIFNRLEILDKSLTLLLVVTIITLGFIYISYRLYILYMRDSKDFDKFKIPFTRTEAANLKTKGTRYSKDSPFKSLGITCVGEECCDASMVYDKLRDKCIATENFGNYFEYAQELNNQEKNIIKQNDPNKDKQNFSYLGGNSNVIENFGTFRTNADLKENLLMKSLKNSSANNF